MMFFSLTNFLTEDLLQFKSAAEFFIDNGECMKGDRKSAPFFITLGEDFFNILFNNLIFHHLSTIESKNEIFIKKFREKIKRSPMKFKDEYSQNELNEKIDVMVENMNIFLRVHEKIEGVDFLDWKNQIKIFD